MRTEAFFSDTTEEFCRPAEPEPGDTIKIRFRMSKEDSASVELVVFGGNKVIRMQEAEETAYFRYFEASLKAGDAPLRWYFCISKDEERFLYDAAGSIGGRTALYPFLVIPGFHTPDWAKGAVFYQIYVDRFRNADPSNSVRNNEYIYLGKRVRRADSWDQLPETFDVGRFYGGDLAGVREKLHYLRGLGVEVIYFNPLFVSPSNHKYDTQDYEHIDPHLTVLAVDEGEVLTPYAANNLTATKYISRSTDPRNLEASDRFFADFVREAHNEGLKILMDGVFNHCGSFNKWLDREKLYSMDGAYEKADSPYRSYFRFEDEKAWPDNKSYEMWWNNETLPKLNYEDSDDLTEKMLSIAEKWLKPPYCADGWRLDVAADLGHSPAQNHRFWARFRETVRKANPNALILAEHYGDPSAWLNGREWDSVMNYDAFMEPVSWFLTGMEKHSDRSEPSLIGDGEAFWKSMSTAMAKLPMPSLYTAMNELSNHDHSRFLTRTNHVVGRLADKGAEAAGIGVDFSVMRQAVLMQMTWPGAPTIYYGDEAGVVGWTDPDSRRTYPWGHENHELIEFHRYIAISRKNCRTLRQGSLVPLLMERDIAAYGRMMEEQQAVIVVYTGREERDYEIPVWLLGIGDDETLRRVIFTYEGNYNVGVMERTVANGMLTIHAKPVSAALFLTEVKKEKK